MTKTYLDHFKMKKDSLFTTTFIALGSSVGWTMHLELSKLNDGKSLPNSRKSVEQKETLSKSHLSPKTQLSLYFLYTKSYIHVYRNNYASPFSLDPFFSLLHIAPQTPSCSLAHTKATRASRTPGHLLAISNYCFWSYSLIYLSPSYTSFILLQIFINAPIWPCAHVPPHQITLLHTSLIPLFVKSKQWFQEIPSKRKKSKET